MTARRSRTRCRRRSHPTARSARPRARSRRTRSTRGGSSRREALLSRCRSSLPPAKRTSVVEAISHEGGWARASSRCSPATITAAALAGGARPSRLENRQRLGAVPEPVRGRRLVLEVLVDLEEVLDLLPERRGDVVDVVDGRPDGVAQRHADQLLVRAFLVRHVEDADRADPYAAAREGRVGDEDERVERVAVLGQRPLDEAVVRRIAHRREQPAVEEDAAELAVELVLVPRAGGDLDEDDGVGHHGHCRGYPCRMDEEGFGGFSFGGNPEDLMRSLREFAEQQSEAVAEAQREQFATLTLNTAVELTGAALKRMQVTGGPDEQAIALRDAMRVLFPEAVALVSAARQGFMRE